MGLGKWLDSVDPVKGVSRGRRGGGGGGRRRGGQRSGETLSQWLLRVKVERRENKAKRIRLQARAARADRAVTAATRDRDRHRAGAAAVKTGPAPRATKATRLTAAEKRYQAARGTGPAVTKKATPKGPRRQPRKAAANAVPDTLPCGRPTDDGTTCRRLTIGGVPCYDHRWGRRATG